MTYVSANPATDITSKQFPDWNEAQLDRALAQVAAVTPTWGALSFAERGAYMRQAALVLRKNRDQLAALITQEMGKLTKEARGEIEKCAGVCDFYAEKAVEYLADEVLASDAGRSFIVHQPLGTVLAVMPWNFPFWQVFRFAAPALMAGNTGVLKHASNVPECALAIENVFVEAGFPAGVFRTLMISASQVERVIADRRIHATTLTGSCPAGRKVGAASGANLKKSVMELGGSDPFIVLEDADLDLAVSTAVLSRFLNAGQSCIAAKRFILLPGIADAFMARFKAAVQALKPGDPTQESTTLAPMARKDLRDELHEQVMRSIGQGAVAVTGCQPLPGVGAFYAASILDHVKSGMLAYSEELFGPVAIVIRAQDEQDAIHIANDTEFGLGGSVWTRDSARGERIARQMQSGAVFVNGLVKSDPRLPFGGIRTSGYGRELSLLGIREFVNSKTIWVR